MKTIQIDYCGMPATGRTVTEAKQAAVRRLTALVHDLRHQAPEVVAVHGRTALLYRDVWGWAYALLQDGDGNPRTGPLYGCTPNATRAETADAARWHLAQIAWCHDVPDDEVFVAAAGVTATKARELVAYFKAARDAGHDDTTAHQIAGGLHSA